VCSSRAVDTCTVGEHLHYLSFPIYCNIEIFADFSASYARPSATPQSPVSKTLVNRLIIENDTSEVHFTVSSVTGEAYIGVVKLQKLGWYFHHLPVSMTQANRPERIA